MSQKETLRIFLEDAETREKYGITEEMANSAEMAGELSNIMIIMIRELISKQTDTNSASIAASQLVSVINNRLK